MSTIAQATATLVIYFRAKQTEEKQVALSAVVPAYLGITEPAIYGVLIKYRGALIAGCIGGGVGAAVSNVMGGVCYGFVMPGLLSLPAFIGKGFFGIIVGMIVTIVVSAVLTFILMNRFNEKEEPEERTGKTEQTTPIDLRIGDVTIQSPVIGEIVPLESISDATFSNEILGKTIAISSIDGTIYAPFDAEVKAVFPTKHAIGLESLATGAEILIRTSFYGRRLPDKNFYLLPLPLADDITQSEFLVDDSFDTIR